MPRPRLLGRGMPRPYSRPRSTPLIIVMQQNASQASIDRVTAEIERMGARPHLSRGQFRTVIGAVGEEANLDQSHLMSLDGVEKVVQVMKPYKLASREFHEDEIGRAHV